jgi:hypothetical protein
MLNPDIVYNARWQDLYTFFAAGNPPLALQLMVINTIILTWYVIRRARGKQPLHAQTAFIIQGILIAANVMIMFAPSVLNTARMMRHMI